MDPVHLILNQLTTLITVMEQPLYKKGIMLVDIAATVAAVVDFQMQIHVNN
jgi:hypothetical protein